MSRHAAGHFHQTVLARGLAAWMLLSVALVLAIGPLCELLPHLPVLNIVAALVVFPVPLLLGFCIKALVRRPTRDWPGLILLLAYCAAFIFGLEPLLTAGARLNFLAHQAAYKRIIAEAHAGLLGPGADSVLAGRRHGVRYVVQPDRRPLAQFEWGGAPDGFFGIVYDKVECFGASSAPSVVASTTSHPARGDGVDAPTMKNAGRLSGPKWRMSDEACLTHIVW